MWDQGPSFHYHVTPGPSPPVSPLIRYWRAVAPALKPIFILALWRTRDAVSDVWSRSRLSSERTRSEETENCTFGLTSRTIASECRRPGMRAPRLSPQRDCRAFPHPNCGIRGVATASINQSFHRGRTCRIALARSIFWLASVAKLSILGSKGRYPSDVHYSVLSLFLSTLRFTFSSIFFSSRDYKQHFFLTERSLTQR